MIGSCAQREKWNKEGKGYALNVREALAVSTFGLIGFEAQLIHFEHQRVGCVDSCRDQKPRLLPYLCNESGVYWAYGRRG